MQPAPGGSSTRPAVTRKVGMGASYSGHAAEPGARSCARRWSGRIWPERADVVSTGRSRGSRPRTGRAVAFGVSQRLGSWIRVGHRRDHDGISGRLELAEQGPTLETFQYATVLLAELGLTVIGRAGTGVAGRTSVHQLRPSAVLVDVGLPDGDGVQLATELSELAGRPHVVITSSDADVITDTMRNSI